MRKGRYLLVVLFIFSLTESMSAFANDEEKVDHFLRKNLDAVQVLLKNETLAKEKKNQQIMSVIREAFDFPKMAKLTLGKRYWPSLTKQQQTQFSELFVDRLKASYLEKLSLYTDEKILFEAPVRVKKKIHVMTELVSEESKFTMLYKFYKSKKKGWRIYDVEIEGVSLITTYRSQFHEVLQTGTIDDLFVKLKKPE